MWQGPDASHESRMHALVARARFVLYTNGYFGVAADAVVDQLLPPPGIPPELAASRSELYILMMAQAALQDVADIAQIVGTIGVLVAVYALLLAQRQLRKTETATRGQMLLGVEQVLAPYEEIRIEALDPEWQPPSPCDTDPKQAVRRRHIHHYMRALSLLKQLLADETIDVTTVDRSYGNRVYHLVRNKTVRSYLSADADRFEAFIQLATRIAAQRPQTCMEAWVGEIES